MRAVGSTVVLYVEPSMATICEWVFRKRKDGTTGRRMEMVIYHYTPLNTCELCGKTSTPKNVHYRSDVHGWAREHKNDFETPALATLCTGCWNKARAVAKKIRAAEECNKLFNNLTRSIRDERRSHRAG